MEEVAATFLCELCDRVFHRHWKREDVDAFFKAHVPEGNPEHLVILCDGCFQLVAEVERIRRIQQGEQRVHNEVLAYYSILQLTF